MIVIPILQGQPEDAEASTTKFIAKLAHSFFAAKQWVRLCYDCKDSQHTEHTLQYLPLILLHHLVRQADLSGPLDGTQRFMRYETMSVLN